MAISPALPRRTPRRRSSHRAVSAPRPAAPLPRRNAGRHIARRSVLAVVVVAVAVVVSIIVGALAATALWRSEDDFLGGLFTAGDLQLTSGTATWAQVTPGVASPLSGTLDETPTDFHTMPGDIVEITVPVETYLRGDNLQAGIRVEFAEPISADIRDGLLAVSFQVDDADGNPVAPAEGPASVGETVPVPGLVGSDAGVRTAWSVRVRVEVLGDYVWTADAPVAAATTWNAGSLDIRLSQVRTGGTP